MQCIHADAVLLYMTSTHNFHIVKSQAHTASPSEMRHLGSHLKLQQLTASGRYVVCAYGTVTVRNECMVSLIARTVELSACEIWYARSSQIVDRKPETLIET